ncbi:3-ketoacyl-CoA thiolase A, peroxisomal [Ceratobasidium sp. UAMH 11750]|nr:3-ketoacyl-CoA thiolase A, peroxisomal [Ceratobasidium sp. UAMH 11750]
MMTRRKAEELGLPVLAKYVTTAVAGLAPRIMGIGPTYAIPMVLEQTGLNTNDVDLFEINEAFASMYVYCVRKLGLDIEKVNANGGAIALGHPLDMFPLLVWLWLMLTFTSGFYARQVPGKSRQALPS